MGLRRLALPAIALGAVLAAAPARADSIDGNWCNMAGNKHMQIEGRRIVTPGGKTMDGRYGRHSFAYVIPESEPGAGSEVSMLLVNENTIQATTGSAASPEMWHRCEQTS
ncbi:MAG: hypothetical protein U1E62_18095 [Alsobacter sp.]